MWGNKNEVTMRGVNVSELDLFHATSYICLPNHRNLIWKDDLIPTLTIDCTPQSFSD